MVEQVYLHCLFFHRNIGIPIKRLIATVGHGRTGVLGLVISLQNHRNDSLQRNIGMKMLRAIAWSMVEEVYVYWPGYFFKET